MESETAIGGNEMAGKLRYAESKVYTRKALGRTKSNRISNYASFSLLASPNSARQTGDNPDNSNLLPGSKNLALQDKQFISQNGRFSQLGADCYDSFDFHRQKIATLSGSQCPDSGNVGGMEWLENRVNIHLGLKSKQERREIRQKLEIELDKVRNLKMEIEAMELQLDCRTCCSPHVTENHELNNGSMSVSLDVHPIAISESNTAQVDFPPGRQSQSTYLSRLCDNTHDMVENSEKKKRTTGENDFSRNCDTDCTKERFQPHESNPNNKVGSKKAGSRKPDNVFAAGSKIFKSCSMLVEKLMKHKDGWVFSTPVDVEQLGLHDYFTIIKNPMDLGTVKSKLKRSCYKSLQQFADDVRLTFRNALTYNPEGHEVHTMAGQMLSMFEEKWAAIYSSNDHDLRPASSHQLDALAIESRGAPLSSPLDAAPSSVTLPKDATSKPTGTIASRRSTVLKKPKARDLHKRDMTLEEKQKLSADLQNLPSEKLDNIVQIIKKRNPTLSQHQDEIEVDIDKVDTETLWELDRFVINHRKNVNKNKRKEEYANQVLPKVLQQAQENLLHPQPLPPETQDHGKSLGDKIVSSPPPVHLDNIGDNGSNHGCSSSSRFSAHSECSVDSHSGRSSSGPGKHT